MQLVELSRQGMETERRGDLALDNEELRNSFSEMWIHLPCDTTDPRYAVRIFHFITC